MNLGTLGLLFLVTLYLQDIQHYTALRAGIALFPLFLPLTLLAPAAGRLTARIGSKLPMTAGLIVAAAGTGLLSTLHTGSGYLMLLPGLLLWGIGLGILTPTVVAAAIGAVPADRSGLASAVNNTARQAAAPSASPPTAPSPANPAATPSSQDSTPSPSSQPRSSSAAPWPSSP